MEIEPGRPEDAEALAALQTLAWREGFGDLMPIDVPPLQLFADGLRDRAEDPATALLVASEDGVPLGFATLGSSRWEDPPVGEVYALFVHPRHWRRGVASALVARALEELSARGCEEATLWSLAENDRANAFYEAAGFGRDGATQRRPQHGDALEARFRRALPPGSPLR